MQAAAEKETARIAPRRWLAWAVFCLRLGLLRPASAMAMRSLISRLCRALGLGLTAARAMHRAIARLMRGVRLRGLPLPWSLALRALFLRNGLLAPFVTAAFLAMSLVTTSLMSAPVLAAIMLVACVLIALLVIVFMTITPTLVSALSITPLLIAGILIASLLIASALIIWVLIA